MISEIELDTNKSVHNLKKTGDFSYNNFLTDKLNINGNKNYKIHLNIRGIDFVVSKEELSNFPKTILLMLFPDEYFYDNKKFNIDERLNCNVIYVDFDPLCFDYILKICLNVQREFNLQKLSDFIEIENVLATNSVLKILRTNPAIVVLKEDLDFYVIPSLFKFNFSQMKYIKNCVANEILKNDYILNSFKIRNKLNKIVSKNSTNYDSYLLHTLHSLGFHSREKWGFRFLEPSKNVIISFLLLKLKKFFDNSSFISLKKKNSKLYNFFLSKIPLLRFSKLMKQKKKNDLNENNLLLFCKKPIKKCWWSEKILNIDIHNSDLFDSNDKKIRVKVHSKRIWTLELSIIGVQ